MRHLPLSPSRSVGGCAGRNAGRKGQAMSDKPEPSGGFSLTGCAVGLGFLGVVGVLPLLCLGFNVVTMGAGLVVGFPCLVLADFLYIVAVAKDLKQHKLL